MAKRILLTGGAGFIGSHLADQLATAGHEVVIVDNFVSGRRDNVSLRDRVRLIEGDIRRPEHWEHRVRGVDVIVHLAALISGYDSLQEPEIYDDVNIRGTMRIIDYAYRWRVPRIVFASSSTVYGDQSEQTLSEKTYANPVTVYALSKLAGEHLLRLFSQVHGFSHCSLRLFNVYGPRQAIDHPYANVTCKFSHAAAKDLAIPLYGDGEQSRDFIYVDDVVSAFLAVLETSPHQVYNVGTGTSASINDLIRELRAISGSILRVEQREAWPNDVRAIRADARLIATDLRVNPRVSLREGLRRTVDFHR